MCFVLENFTQDPLLILKGVEGLLILKGVEGLQLLDGHLQNLQHPHSEDMLFLLLLTEQS
jgi:hypothetical protein